MQRAADCRYAEDAEADAALWLFDIVTRLMPRHYAAMLFMPCADIAAAMRLRQIYNIQRHACMLFAIITKYSAVAEVTLFFICERHIRHVASAVV